MRLRLVIRRHSLPDTAVVWAIEPGDNPTISQLLEQVNEVVPLESSGDWGLEDYSVEIRGASTNYECLHFQLIGAILHEDDEVLIRPLLSQDLKLRKVAGRHQITTDGKHLFDGSVFGRPQPRILLDRPAIEIPPRKRRRITYDDETYASFDDSPASEDRSQAMGDPKSVHQLLIRSKFDNVDDEYDEDDDEDFEPEEEAEDPEETQDEAEGLVDTEEAGGQDILYGVKERGDQDGDISSSTDSSSESSESSEDSENSEDEKESDETSSDEDTSSSDATSTSDSDSNSEPDEVSSKPPMALSSQSRVQDAVAAVGMLSKGLGSMQNVVHAPGQGKSSTRRRNARRRQFNMFCRFKRNGTIPAGMTTSEFDEITLDEPQSPEDTSQALPETRTQGPQICMGSSDKATPKDDIFEARRQHLLASLGSGGVEIGPGELSGASMAFAIKSSKRTYPKTWPVEEEEEYIHRPVAATEEYDLSKQGDAANDNACDRGSPLTSNIDGLDSSIEPIGDNSTERSRRKVDLGAAGRLLFGALGVRAPKSKADHERVRHELTKNIRTPKALTTAQTVSEEIPPASLDENSDAWRESLTLRAVECCNEGIELSPAPFPFAQRWDPQQQGPRPKMSGRGGKGKKAQRSQPQYYHEQRQGSKKRRRRETSYDSDGEYAFADATEYDGEFYPNMEVDDAGRQNVHNEIVDEYGVNDQLMRDVQDAATSQIADEDDLPQLPEDISTLSELTASNVTTGMVITFKQLILSEASHWQPEISAYRTAVVIVVSDNGDLQLTLAKRDRDQGEKCYDDETGERIYGKFSMPAYDDESDDVNDDGFLSVSFKELIEPKIVQQALESFMSAEEPHANVDLSGDESTELSHEDSAEVSGNVKDNAIATLNGAADDLDNGLEKGFENEVVEDDGLHPAEHLSAYDAEEITAFPISDGTRQEISDIIKEAGFRSSVSSSVTRAQPVLPVTSPEDDLKSGSYSPQFNGFGSSPSIQAISSPACFAAVAAPEEELPVLESRDSSPGNDASAPSVLYPKLSVPSSLASQVSDRGHQPDYSAPGDSTLDAFDHDNSFLDVREDSPGSAHLGFPSSQPNHAGTHSPAVPHSPSPDGLPSLAEFFLSTRSDKPESKIAYPAGTFKTEDNQASDSYDRAVEALDAQLDLAEDDSEQVTPKASQMNAKGIFPSISDAKKLWGEDRKTCQKFKSGMPPGSQKGGKSQFVIPPGSQQIDLTLSSDAEAEVEDGHDPDHDDSGLPSGLGWVKKKGQKDRRQSSAVPTRAASQFGSQGRTARRKTMARF